MPSLDWVKKCGWRTFWHNLAAIQVPWSPDSSKNRGGRMFWRKLRTLEDLSRQRATDVVGSPFMTPFGMAFLHPESLCHQRLAPPVPVLHSAADPPGGGRHNLSADR